MNLTAKQEAFAQAVASGKTQADAYRLAFNATKSTDKSVWELASTLMANVKVASRVEAIRAPVTESTQYGLKTAMQEALDAYEVARGANNGGAMTAAATLRAKLNGLLIERKEIRTGPLSSLRRCLHPWLPHMRLAPLAWLF